MKTQNAMSLRDFAFRVFPEIPDFGILFPHVWVQLFLAILVIFGVVTCIE